MLNISSFVPKLKTLFKRQYQHIKHIEGVLGTSLELQVLADSKLTTQIAETRVLNEILRLEQVYSSFLADSELNRWQTAGHGIPSADLAWLLLEAEKWLTQIPRAKRVLTPPMPKFTGGRDGFVHLNAQFAGGFVFLGHRDYPEPSRMDLWHRNNPQRLYGNNAQKLVAKWQSGLVDHC